MEIKFKNVYEGLEMNKQEQLALAKDAAATADQLAPLAGQHIEIDRLLALHANASTELLESLIYAEDEDGNYDRAVRTGVVAHPNVSPDTFAELATYYPSAAVQNPSLVGMFKKDASLLERCEHLLELPACPAKLLDKAFASGSYPAKLRTLQNPNLSAQLRSRLAPELLDAEAKAALGKFEAKQKDELSKGYVQTYIQQARPLPYAVPVYLPFDASDPAHRLADQVICGFPYTCAAWPWPQDFNGGHMQPIAQLDLTRAGEALGENLGKGLLQVWFSVDPTSANKGSWRPLLRVIPREALTEPMDSFYPADAPWDPARESDEWGGCIFSHSRKTVPSARVQWAALGRMYPRPYWVMNEWCDNTPKMTESKAEKLEKKIEALDIPSMDSAYLDPKSKAIHLGGYVAGYGNEADLVSWADNSRRLLFYVSEEEGIFAMAVTFDRDESGQVTFRADLSSDH